MITRRRLLLAAAATPFVLSATGCTRGAAAPSAGAPIAVGSTARSLPIPPLATAQVGADGVRRFQLVAQPGSSEMIAGKRTPTWGYNGSMLGPTLRARRGETVAATITNHLPEPTSVHWHGMHVPARCDGGPHQVIGVGATWDAQWTVNQPAASLWYHPHPHGATERHVYRGLSGLFLIDDDVSDGLDLPKNYGVDDIPLVVQDRRFTPDGTLDETDDDTYGLLGDTIITNGITDAHLVVGIGQLRLRILNGSAARLLNLAFADDREFQLIATDGGLLRNPVSLRRIQLSPAERAEIVVALKPGETTTLRTLPIEPRDGLDNPARFGFDDTFDILVLQAASELTAAPPIPDTLVAIAPLVAPGTPANPNLRFALVHDQRSTHGHEPHRSHRSGRYHRGLVGSQHSRLAAQLPRPRRPVPDRRDRRGPSPTAVVRVEGHGVRRTGAHRDAGHALCRLHRPNPSVHVPLPPVAPRGPRHDGPVPGARPRRGARPDDDAGNGSRNGHGVARRPLSGTRRSIVHKTLPVASLAPIGP